MYIKKNFLIETITMSVIVLFAFVSSGQAVPNYLNYQGRLVNPSTGQPISDGSHNATFRIYGNATGGSVLWEYTYSVPTKNGLFNALLGPIDASVFDGSDRWMEVEVDGETIGSRQRIVSVAYAIRATSAGDIDVNPGSDANADLITVGVTGTPKLNWLESEDSFSLNKPLNISGTGNGSYWDGLKLGTWPVLSMIDDASDNKIAFGSFFGGGGWQELHFYTNNQECMRMDNNGNVGIGTTGPDRKLDILDASNPQLRLTNTDGSVYTDFQTDSNGNMMVTASGRVFNINGTSKAIHSAYTHLGVGNIGTITGLTVGAGHHEFTMMVNGFWETGGGIEYITTGAYCTI